MKVAGVDGTKGGWIAIVLDGGAYARDHVLPIDAGSAAERDLV